MSDKKAKFQGPTKKYQGVENSNMKHYHNIL